MQKFFLLFISLLFTACSHLYYEPPLTSHNATLKIDVEYPFTFNAPFGMTIVAELDGKLIHRARYPSLIVGVTPGKHKLAVGITAYYHNRAKYYFTKEYEIEFQSQEKYIISSKAKSSTLKSNTDNVDATLNIVGKGINILNTVTLEDSMMRSMVCVAPCAMPVILLN